jgi:hypothetical protein
VRGQGPGEEGRLYCVSVQVKARASWGSGATFGVRSEGFLLFLLTLTGCDSGPHRTTTDDPRTSPSSHARLARTLGVDAAALSEPAVPPSPPGDLASELAEFTTLDACVKEHASKDPLVSDALGALGYDTFLRDACRTLEAAHTKSSKPCALIDASGLRRECRSTLAIVTGDPDGCPQRADDAPRLGREPTCLAAASGDARLCAAESGERRARCEAITTRDEGRCGRSGVGKGACVRDVARWKSAIAVSPGTDAPFKVGAQVMVSSADRMFDAGRIDVDLRSLAAAGVVLVREPRSEVSCEVGVAHESGAAPLAPSPEMGTRLAFAFVVAKDGKAKLRHLELALPGHAMLVVPPLHWDGEVGLTNANKRGDAVTIRAHGEVSATPHSYNVEIEVETFIEDVIDRNSSAVEHDR